MDQEPGDLPDATTTITSDTHTFVLWGTKRADWREHVAIEGDAEPAEHFLDTLNIV